MSKVADWDGERNTWFEAQIISKRRNSRTPIEWFAEESDGRVWRVRRYDVAPGLGFATERSFHNE